MIGVDVQALSKLFYVFKPFSRVLFALPSSPTSSASTFPDMYKLVHALEVLFENRSVVYFLFGVRSVDWEFFVSFFELLIRDCFIASALKLGYPGHANAFTLHGLGSPEDWVWNISLIRFS